MKVFFEKKNLKFELEAAAAHHYYLDEDGHVDEHGGGGDQRSGMAEQRIGGICTTKTQFGVSQRSSIQQTFQKWTCKDALYSNAGTTTVLTRECSKNRKK